jgi:hypothetical protein
VVKEGYDNIVQTRCAGRRARDFVLGHLRIQIAVLFGEVNGTFSDALTKSAHAPGRSFFAKAGRKIFEMDDIREQVKDITNQGQAAREARLSAVTPTDGPSACAAASR